MGTGGNQLARALRQCRVWRAGQDVLGQGQGDGTLAQTFRAADQQPMSKAPRIQCSHGLVEGALLPGRKCGGHGIGSVCGVLGSRRRCR